MTSPKIDPRRFSIQAAKIPLHGGGLAMRVDMAAFEGSVINPTSISVYFFYDTASCEQWLNQASLSPDDKGTISTVLNDGRRLPQRSPSQMTRFIGEMALVLYSQTHPPATGPQFPPGGRAQSDASHHPATS